MSDQDAATTVRNTFQPVLKGAGVDMKNAGAMAVIAQGDVRIREGGAQLMVAKGDLSVEQGGAQTMLAGGDITMRDAGALLVAGKSVTVTDGWVGVAFGAHVDIENSRVILGPRQALAFGAGFGVAVAIARRLLNR